MSRRWRRKILAAFVLVILAPTLLSMVLGAATQAAQIIGHLVQVVWPWVAGVLAMLLAAYLLRALYYRRRW